MEEAEEEEEKEEEEEEERKTHHRIPQPDHTLPQRLPVEPVDVLRRRSLLHANLVHMPLDLLVQSPCHLPAFRPITIPDPVHLLHRLLAQKLTPSLRRLVVESAEANMDFIERCVVVSAEFDLEPEGNVEGEEGEVRVRRLVGVERVVKKLEGEGVQLRYVENMASSPLEGERLCGNLTSR